MSSRRPAPDPATPVARPQKSAKRAKAARDAEAMAQGAGLTPPEDTRTQAQKFEDAARELGTDQDEDRFKDVLRTLAKPKT